jgi:hypothetical protein
MDMSQAPADPTTDSSHTTTPLAHAIEHIDRDTDERSCPHECHGSLSVTDGRVLCETCRCTPDGVYLPPVNESSLNEGRCSQYLWFYPKGSRPEDHVAEQAFEHEEYDGNGDTTLVRVRMVGGYQDVYDESLPAGEGDAYEWDISSL